MRSKTVTRILLETSSETIERVNEVANRLLELARPILVSTLTSENVEDMVNDFPTKYVMGFTFAEISELLRMYKIDNDIFYNKLGVNTVGVVDGGFVTYHCDILKALLCIIENRDENLEEWD